MEVIPYHMYLLYSYNNSGKFINVNSHIVRLSCNICSLLSHDHNLLKRYEYGRTIYAIYYHQTQFYLRLKIIDKVGIVLRQTPRKNWRSWLLISTLIVSNHISLTNIQKHKCWYLSPIFNDISDAEKRCNQMCLCLYLWSPCPDNLLIIRWWCSKPRAEGIQTLDSGLIFSTMYDCPIDGFGPPSLPPPRFPRPCSVSTATFPARASLYLLLLPPLRPFFCYWSPPQ